MSPTPNNSITLNQEADRQRAQKSHTAIQLANESNVTLLVPSVCQFYANFLKPQTDNQ